MIYTPKTKKAMIIAYNAHNGQVDKSGIPYIYHPIHLAEQMDTETECIVALLHDVVGDTWWIRKRIFIRGYWSIEIINTW